MVGKSIATASPGDDLQADQGGLAMMASDQTEGLMKKVEVEAAIRERECLLMYGVVEDFQEVVRQLRGVEDPGEAAGEVAREKATVALESSPPGGGCLQSSRMVASWKWKDSTGPVAGSHRQREVVARRD